MGRTSENVARDVVPNMYNRCGEGEQGRIKNFVCGRERRFFGLFWLLPRTGEDVE